jgi:hypothetical protein
LLCPRFPQPRKGRTGCKGKTNIDKTAKRIVALDRDGTAGSRKLSALWKF